MVIAADIDSSKISYCPVMIDPDAGQPTYRQLADILRQQITSGQLTGRLRGERYMAAEYGIAIGTVRKAIAVLRDEGLVETVHGWGTTVRVR